MKSYFVYKTDYYLEMFCPPHWKKIDKPGFH